MKKNGLTLSLMFTSIALLLILQAVCLQSVYRNIKRDLRKETSILFSSTVMAMQDSIIRFEGKRTRSESSAGFSTEPFPFSPRGLFYGAHFPDVRIFVFKKIAPQLLFSAFLTMLTVASFSLMYRSIRSGQRLVEIKNDFIGNITHELKTPIATASVAIE